VVRSETDGLSPGALRGDGFARLAWRPFAAPLLNAADSRISVVLTGTFRPVRSLALAMRLAENRGMNYGCSAAMGAVSGLRAFTGPAILSEAAIHKNLTVKRTPVAWLGSSNAAKTSALLAAAELVADKLPLTPRRTNAAGLIARGVSGAICGMAVVGRGRKKELVIGAVVGATAAMASAWLGYQYRQRVKLPKFVAAILEDAVAVSAGTAVVRAMCR